MKAEIGTEAGDARLHLRILQFAFDAFNRAGQRRQLPVQCRQVQ
jgi:hypothetical protein